jgi:hypothetical protein
MASAYRASLLDRAADHLERLAKDRTLGDEQRAVVDAALELALIAREELSVGDTGLVEIF